MGSEERSSILIIYTGGTIGMIRNSVTGALESFNFEHLVRRVPVVKEIQKMIDCAKELPGKMTY